MDKNNYELKFIGTQDFMDMNIPIIEGGFGEGKRNILVKTISEIHNYPIKKINQLINDNIDEFEFGVDIIDLKTRYFESTEFLTTVMNKQSISNSSHIYLLSEQGYMLLVGFMKTEKAKEIRKNLRREYFSMRQELNSLKQKKAMLLLSIYNGGQDAVTASKELTQMEIKEATAPLIAENEHKQEIINGFTDDLDIYKKRAIINRICKRSSGNYANRYKELYKCFKETFHIDLDARKDGYNIKKTKQKDKLNTIGYAEKFGHIDDLYTCCVKLYETEVESVLKELQNAQKSN